MDEVNKAPRTPGRPSDDEKSVGRDQILEMAKQLVREVPPSQISRREVARRAEVDPSLIRYYFGTVKDLMREVTLEIWNDISRRTAQAVQQLDDPEAKVRARVANLMQIMEQNPHFHALMLDNVLLPGPLVNAAGQAKYFDIRVQELNSFIEEGVEAGVFRPVDARFLFVSIVGMCQFFFESGVLKESLFDKEETSDLSQRYASFVADLVIGGLSPTK